MRRVVLFVATMMMLATAGCSDTSTETASDPIAMLSAAHDAFASAGSVQFTLTSDDVPKGSEGVTAADGVGALNEATPMFEGTVTGSLQGVSGNFKVIAIGDEAWIKFFTPTFVQVDLDSLGSPNPAQLFNPTIGLPSLLEETTDLALSEQQRDGDEVLDTVTGTLPGELVSSLLKLGEAGSNFDVTYGITADGELRKAVLTGEFYAGATSTYTLIVKDYGTAVDIARP